MSGSRRLGRHWHFRWRRLRFRNDGIGRKIRRRVLSKILEFRYDCSRWRLDFWDGFCRFIAGNSCSRFDFDARNRWLNRLVVSIKTGYLRFSWSFRLVRRMRSRLNFHGNSIDRFYSCTSRKVKSWSIVCLDLFPSERVVFPHFRFHFLDTHGSLMRFPIRTLESRMFRRCRNHLIGYRGRCSSR